MALLRSLIFNTLFYISIILYMIAGLPVMLLPRPWIMGYARTWSRYFVWLTATFAGIKMEVRGREHLHPGPLLIAPGRQLIMFPEGTRRPVGAPPAYRTGIAHVYGALDVAVTPVAMNSGVFWPRRSLKLRPGTIVIEFLPEIPAGLDRDTFMKTLETAIETTTNRLVAEAERAS